MLLNTALKEWAAVVAALEHGDQAILLRKGGLIEQTGEFEVEHRRFLLFPTTYHPTPAQVRPEYRPLMERVEAERPPSGQVRISAWAEAIESRPVETAEGARRLAAHTIYTEEYAEERFTMQKHRVLQLVILRVYRLPEPRRIALRRHYGGCTSWVDLEDTLAVEGSTPALADEAFAELAEAVRPTLLQPTAT